MSETIPWLTRKQASQFLASMGCPISPQTLANMAANNNALQGPSFRRTKQRIVRYHRDDLKAWVARQSVLVN